MTTLRTVLCHTALMIAAIILLTAGNAGAIETPWLHVEGPDIKDPDGNTVILRGVSLIGIGVMDARTGLNDLNTVGMIDMLTDPSRGWYATVVRLPCYPSWDDGATGYLADPAGYLENHIRPAVEKCVEKGVYCIIDWHYVEDPELVDAETRQFWNHVALLFKDYPNVLFEVFNENSTGDSWAEWKAVAQPWVDIIRSHAPDNLILVGGPQWCQRMSGAYDDPLEGDNIVYVGHYYPGSWFNVNEEAELGVLTSKYPVFMSEWGYGNDYTDHLKGTEQNFGLPLKEFVEKHGMSWTAWVADYSWGPAMFHSDWTPRSGPDYHGGFTREWLYERRYDDLPGAPAIAPPEVVMTSPADGAVIDEHTDIVIDAGITGDNVVRAEFWTDNEKLGETASAPWQFTWADVTARGYPEKDYTLYVRAVDTAGARAEDWATVTVIGDEISRNNLIRNAEFDDGAGQWSFWAESSAGPVFEYGVVGDGGLSGDNAIHYNITDGTETNWYIQMMQLVGIESGQRYEVSFMARSGSEANIMLNLQENGGDWALYWQQEVTIHEAGWYGPFVFDSAADDDACWFKFLLGNLQDVNIWLDAVRVLPVDGPAGVDAAESEHPAGFFLGRNTPNPFNPDTAISFGIPAEGSVQLVVHDIRGAKVRTLVDDRLAAGAHRVAWDGADDTGVPVSSGVYFYHIRVRSVNGVFSDTGRMTIVK